MVNEGQAVAVTAQGWFIASYHEPGEHVFEDKDRPFGIKGALKDFERRFSFGGDAPAIIHRIYYINTKECTGNPFSTA